MGLSLLAPWFLAGAAAVAVPIALHLLARHTAPEVLFSATRFVPGAPVEQRRRRRPTDLWLLALRCLALVLLAFGFARPYFAGAAATAGVPVTVVALDVSFSMAGESTWAEAQAAAARAIDEAPAGGAVALVAFDEVARLLVPPTLDRSAARAAVAAARPGLGATSFRAISTPVAELLAGRAGRVVLVTDLQRNALTGALALPPSTSLEVKAVQPARTNVSVDALSREANAVVATLTNHGLTAREVGVQAQVDDGPPIRRQLSIAEGTTVSVRFEGAAAPRGVTRVRLADEGGLPADDERFLVLDPPRPLRVWVIGRRSGSDDDGFYLGAALASAATRRAIEVRRVDLPLDRLPQGFDGDGRPDVVALLATRGLAAEARTQIEAVVTQGGGLLVSVGPGSEAGVLSQLFPSTGGVIVEQADAVPLPTALVPVDVRHPLFGAYVDRTSAYASVRFDRVVRVRLAEGDRVLGRFENGLAAILERRIGRGRMVVLASDLDTRWNQWPASATFLPFATEAITYLAAREQAPTELLVGSVPAGLQAVPGAHVLDDGRRVAVNVDPRESSIDLSLEADVLAAVTAAADAPSAEVVAASRESSQGVWRYVFLSLMVVLVVESVVGARRAVTV